MATCPNGHESEWEDYCSVCGAALGGAGPAVSSTDPDPAPAEEVAAAGADGTIACPNCGESANADDVFCEACGYDFLSGSLPDAEEEPVAAAPEQSASPLASKAEVRIDLEFFERMGFDGVDPPAVAPAPVVVDLPPTEILIGRSSESRGTFPEIDLHALFDEAAQDPAVSSSHAMLRRAGDGWTVTDLGSTNGTYVDGSNDPIRPGALVTLGPGAVVNVGAWTAITLIN